jgi:hypothetical protein
LLHGAGAGHDHAGHPVERPAPGGAACRRSTPSIASTRCGWSVAWASTARVRPECGRVRAGRWPPRPTAPGGGGTGPAAVIRHDGHLGHDARLCGWRSLKRSWRSIDRRYGAFVCSHRGASVASAVATLSSMSWSSPRARSPAGASATSPGRTPRCLQSQPEGLSRRRTSRSGAGRTALPPAQPRSICLRR